jgi:hypothetical protein
MDRNQSDPSILYRIIAIGETWLRSYDPLNPQSAAEWRLPGETLYEIMQFWKIYFP